VDEISAQVADTQYLFHNAYLVIMSRGYQILNGHQVDKSDEVPLYTRSVIGATSANHCFPQEKPPPRPTSCVSERLLVSIDPGREESKGDCRSVMSIDPCLSILR
jgi:hypothetical protein